MNNTTTPQKLFLLFSIFVSSCAYSHVPDSENHYGYLAPSDFNSTNNNDEIIVRGVPTEIFISKAEKETLKFIEEAKNIDRKSEEGQKKLVLLAELAVKNGAIEKYMSPYLLNK